MLAETLTLHQTSNYTFTDQDRQRGHTLTDADTAKATLIRQNPILKLREAQVVLHKIITGAVRYHDGEQVIDIPAREIASCSVALCKLEERIRLNQGKPNPAPFKPETKRKSSSSRSDKLRSLEPIPAGPGPDITSPDKTVPGSS